MPTKSNNSKGIATRSARLAERGFLCHAHAVTYLLQTNQKEFAYKVLEMETGQFVHAGENKTGQIVKVECGHATVRWADGEIIDEPFDRLTKANAPYRIYSRSKGWQSDAGTVLHYAVQLLHKYQDIIGDATLMEHNGQEWVEVR